MRADKAAFVRCIAEKMLTYALGRGLEDYDRRAVNAIMAATGKVMVPEFSPRGA